MEETDRENKYKKSNKREPVENFENDRSNAYHDENIVLSCPPHVL